MRMRMRLYAINVRQIQTLRESDSSPSIPASLAEQLFAFLKKLSWTAGSCGRWAAIRRANVVVGFKQSDTFTSRAVNAFLNEFANH